MLPIILGALFSVLFVVMYLGLYYLNKNTAVPESAKQRHKEAQGCTACGSINKFNVPKEVVDKFKEEYL